MRTRWFLVGMVVTLVGFLAVVMSLPEGWD